MIENGAQVELLHIWDDEISQAHQLLEQSRAAAAADDFPAAYAALQKAGLLMTAIQITLIDYERACGRSWREIGLTRGMTRQAAHRHYRRLIA